jgi:hypothetical protein
MDKRREPRFVADQTVTVTLLREPQASIVAKVQNYSGRGLGLITATAISPGTALRIVMDDAMILGEAVYCRQELDHCYVGIELNQVLAGLAELGRRLQEFSPSGSGGETVYASDHRDEKNR